MASRRENYAAFQTTGSREFPKSVPGARHQTKNMASQRCSLLERLLSEIVYYNQLPDDTGNISDISLHAEQVLPDDSMCYYYY